jgi:hypothetical protein
MPLNNPFRTKNFSFAFYEQSLAELKGKKYFFLTFQEYFLSMNKDLGTGFLNQYPIGNQQGFKKILPHKA